MLSTPRSPRTCGTRAATTCWGAPAGSPSGPHERRRSPGNPGGTMFVTKPLVAEQPEEIYLPQAPDDQEKYKYFGGPRRWAFAWLLIASAGVLYGYIHVAERAWLVAPLMWLLLMVMVPPVVVNFWLRFGHPRLTLAEHQANVASYREHGESVDVF